MASYRYRVYGQLAGNSASRRFINVYSRLSAAKRYADKNTGYGHIAVVVDNQTGETVYRGRGTNA